MNKKEYFLLQFNEKQKLCFKKDGCCYYPATTWNDATEGLITNVEVIESFEDEYHSPCAYITGAMVSTGKFNFNSDISLKINHLLVVGDTILVHFEDTKDYDLYYAKLDTDDLVPVKLSHGRYFLGTKKECMDQLKQITTYIKETQSCLNKVDAMAVCINHFKELELHGADEISVYDDCIFFIGYPGWYRDGCTSFYITSNDEVKYTNLGSIFDRVPQQENKTISFSAASLFAYMKQHNISVGEDSGHDIPNLPQEYRNMFVTKELKSGGIYVSLNADTFFPELLQNETIMTYVDEPLASWMVLEGAYCSHADFFD